VDLYSLKDKLEFSLKVQFALTFCGNGQSLLGRLRPHY